MTKREMFEKVLSFEEVKANPEIVKGIEHEIELLTRKNSGNRKPTANQKLNEEIKNKIVEILVEPMKATAIMKAIQGFFPETDLSVQRVSAILKQLVDQNRVKKEKIKRESFFSRVEG